MTSSAPPGGNMRTWNRGRLFFMAAGLALAVHAPAEDISASGWRLWPDPQGRVEGRRDLPSRRRRLAQAAGASAHWRLAGPHGKPRHPGRVAQHRGGTRLGQVRHTFLFAVRGPARRADVVSQRQLPRRLVVVAGDSRARLQGRPARDRLVPRRAAAQRGLRQRQALRLLDHDRIALHRGPDRRGAIGRDRAARRPHHQPRRSFRLARLRQCADHLGQIHAASIPRFRRAGPRYSARGPRRQFRDRPRRHQRTRPSPHPFGRRGFQHESHVYGSRPFPDFCATARPSGRATSV